jgi:lipocalin
LSEDWARKEGVRASREEETWVMGRTPTVESATLKRIVDRARAGREVVER